MGACDDRSPSQSRARAVSVGAGPCARPGFGGRVHARHPRVGATLVLAQAEASDQPADAAQRALDVLEQVPGSIAGWSQGPGAASGRRLPCQGFFLMARAAAQVTSATMNRPPHPSLACIFACASH